MASAAAGGPLLADEEDVVEDTLGKAEADPAEDARHMFLFRLIGRCTLVYFRSQGLIHVYLIMTKYLFIV